jgi:hypothetical protein
MGFDDGLAAWASATCENGGFSARRLQRWALGESGTRNQRTPIGPLAARVGDGRLRAFRDDGCGAWPQLPPTSASDSTAEPETSGQVLDRGRA